MPCGLADDLSDANSDSLDIEKDFMIVKLIFSKTHNIFFKVIQYLFDYQVHVFSDIFCEKYD